MPYKNREQFNKYMRDYMKRQRRLHAQAKRQMQADLKSMENLRRNFPTAYQLLFGKQKRRK
jgi:hypothetical protein